MEKDIPKVAIVTRTKDRIILLERAIKSIHSQTITNFVHVIINDGGDPDQVDALIEKYNKIICGRIKLIHNKESAGKEDTILTAAANAVHSTYIAIHDDDDTWHPQFLEYTIGHLERTGAMGVVVRTDKVTEKVVEKKSKIKQLKVKPWLGDVKAINLYRQCIDNQMTPITFLYHRTAFDELGGYDKDLAVCGDWDFGIRFMLKYDVDFLDPGFALACYHHRKYKKGAIGNTSAAGNERSRYYANKLMNKYLRQEINSGDLGVGYIMSKLRYDESRTARLVKKLLPSLIVDMLKKRIQN